VVKYRSSVFPDEGSDQVLALELSNRLNLYEYIRLARGFQSAPGVNVRVRHELRLRV
jgi:hypothetical protein